MLTVDVTALHGLMSVVVKVKVAGPLNPAAGVQVDVKELALLKEALVADATYRFGRKKPELSKDEVEACREKILKLLNGVESHHDIKRIADAMAIGYHIQKSLEQAEPTQ